MSLEPADRALRILAVGAHCDDIEIGAGASLARWARETPGLELTCVVLTSTPARAAESEACLQTVAGPATLTVMIHELRDSRLPVAFNEVKDILGDLSRTAWDLVLTHHADDAHQDHALLGKMAPTAFRDHTLWHFEIPKWDGDLGALKPNIYVPHDLSDIDAKWQALNTHYSSQREKTWWRSDTFSGLARLRGMECRAEYAEAFSAAKLVVRSLASSIDRGDRWHSQL